jgi:hypothetical protein
LTTLDLAFRPSLRALKLLSLLHCAAALLLIFTAPPLPVAVGCSVALLVSWSTTRRHPEFGYGKKAVTRLVWADDGALGVAIASGQLAPARLLPRSVVTGALLCLQFRYIEGEGFVSRMLLGDEADAEQLRRLRARLLLQRPASKPEKLRDAA